MMANWGWTILFLIVLLTAQFGAWAPWLVGIRSGHGEARWLHEADSSSSPFLALFYPRFLTLRGSGTARNAHSDDCFSTANAATLSVGPDYDRPRVLRTPLASRRKAGRYRDRLTLHVTLKIPSNDDNDGSGLDDSARATATTATVSGELIVVADTAVKTAVDDPDVSSRPRAHVLYQEVVARATATTVTAASGLVETPDTTIDEPPAEWIEVCHATATTRAQFITSAMKGTAAARAIGLLGLGRARGGFGGFLRGHRRRLLELSGVAPRPFDADDPRCASLLGAVAGRFAPSPPFDRPANDGEPLPAALLPLTASSLADRYLDAIPTHPIRPGDTWPVLPRGRSSFTGGATLLGYQSSSCAGTHDEAINVPTNLAVIQVRGTKSVDEDDVLEALARSTASMRTVPSGWWWPSSLRVVASDADAVVTLHVDVTTQLVRYATIDLSFTLHATMHSAAVSVDASHGGAGTTTTTTTTTIPVRGSAVLETWQL